MAVMLLQILAFIGVLTDPTTKGFSDSEQAYRLVISAAVTADRAKFLIRQRIALRAVSDILPRLDHRGRQPFHLIHMPLDDVKRLASTMVEARENVRQSQTGDPDHDRDRGHRRAGERGVERH